MKVSWLKKVHNAQTGAKGWYDGATFYPINKGFKEGVKVAPDLVRDGWPETDGITWALRVLAVLWIIVVIAWWL